MPRRALPLLLISTVLAFAPQARALLFKVSNIAVVSAAEMVEDLKKARIVLVGEQHDRREHHEAQLAVIEALREGGAKVAVGLEMFRADAQIQLDLWVAGRLGDREFFQLFADHWDERLWPLYSDIFYHARRHQIPLVGLNVPRPLVTQVARQGFASLDEGQRRELGVVRCDVDEKYQNLIGLVLGRKDQGSETFGRFCEAQVVWDTAMARNALRYLEGSPDRLLVILAGSFHAWKHGIPEQLGRLSGVPYRVILPSSDDGFFRYDLVLEDADYVWWHE